MFRERVSGFSESRILRQLDDEARCGGGCVIVCLMEEPSAIRGAEIENAIIMERFVAVFPGEVTDSLSKPSFSLTRVFLSQNLSRVLDDTCDHQCRQVL